MTNEHLICTRKNIDWTLVMADIFYLFYDTIIFLNKYKLFYI